MYANVWTFEFVNEATKAMLDVYTSSVIAKEQFESGLVFRLLVETSTTSMIGVFVYGNEIAAKARYKKHGAKFTASLREQGNRVHITSGPVQELLQNEEYSNLLNSNKTSE